MPNHHLNHWWPVQLHIYASSDLSVLTGTKKWVPNKSDIFRVWDTTLHVLITKILYFINQPLSMLLTDIIYFLITTKCCSLSISRNLFHYGDVIMRATASQITSLTIVCWTVYSDANQRKHQSSASLAFVRGIHRGPVNSPHKGPVTRKMFLFDDVIMLPKSIICSLWYYGLH